MCCFPVPLVIYFFSGYVADRCTAICGFRLSVKYEKASIYYGSRRQIVRIGGAIRNVVLLALVKGEFAPVRSAFTVIPRQLARS